MANEKFYLNFITNGEGLVSIDEPIGFDGADFVSKQKSKGLARDVSFSGGESEFTFYRNRNHYLDTLLYYFETFGWESEVKLVIEINGIDNIVGDLHFAEVDTDLLEYFKCKIVQDSNQALLKRRSDLNVNVFSEGDIDGNEISGLSTENVLVKAKPITQSSSWETPEAFIRNINVDAGQLESDTEHFIFNPAVNLTSFGIDDSYTISQNIRGVETLGTSNAIKENDFIIVEAQNNIRNIEINLSNLDYNINANVLFGNGHADYELELRYGADWSTAETIKFFSARLESGESYSDTNNYTHTIDSLNRGDKIWVYFYCKINALGALFNGASIDVGVTINSFNVGISGSSIAYSTIVPSIRLKDGVSQVVKSISGLTTSFPLAEPNGEMYNQRIFNGNLLRNLTDRAFNISFKDIQEWLEEIYGDYETQSDGSVFFGTYSDYYKNIEIGVFTDVTFDDYSKTLNERYSINEFSYKYKKYQSQKENEVENTFDIAHGESQWSVQNKFVENKKEIDIPFVRCSFYLDEQRRKAFDLNNNTSTQDDDTIFILDTKELSQDLQFTETDFLQHTYNEDTGYLKLTNTGSFSFILLGLAVNESFVLLDDTNAGTYTIKEVTERYIVIDNGFGTIANNGERNTQFTYIVSKTTAPFISWSNEGFEYIDGIVDSDNFANLKYTVKRNITRFYNQYLATCNLFAKKPIKNTKYNNNGELSLSYQGVQTVENAEFAPINPILSPYKHKVTLITDFNNYKSIESKVKTLRGYIRTFDANGHVIKIFPKEQTFVNSSEIGELVIDGEEKYEKSILNITYSGNGYISVNNEYRMPKIKYKEDGEKISLLDENGLLLYNPVFWQKVSLNGAVASTKIELKEWLSSIS